MKRARTEDRVLSRKVAPVLMLVLLSMLIVWAPAGAATALAEEEERESATAEPGPSAEEARRGELLDESGSSPHSRQELLRRQRLDKQTQIRPYAPNRVERELLKLDKADKPSIQDLNFQGFYPRIEWPSRGSGPALGVRFWQRDIKGPLDLAGSAFYSWRNYRHHDVQFGKIPHLGSRLPDRSWKGDDLNELGDSPPGLGRLPFYVTFRYRYLPEEDYFGEGPDSRLEDRSTYLREESQVYLRTGYQLSERIAWIVEGGYMKNSLGPGRAGNLPTTQEIFDEGTAPGLTEAPSYVRYGTSVLLDFRDEPGNPHKGLMVALGAARFDDRSEGDFSFHRLGLDTRAAIPLGSLQRVLALRAVLLRDEADPGHRVPFFMHESLGGSHSLRGFDSFRFRGERVMLYQAEYRWEPSSIWELAVFTDAGTVSEGASELRFSDLEWDYGVGTRFKTWRSVVLRLEVAWSRETVRYYFRTSAAF